MTTDTRDALLSEFAEWARQVAERTGIPPGVRKAAEDLHRRALRTPRPEDARDGWRPIATAPIDTLILLLIDYSNVPVVGTMSDKRCWVHTEHYEVDCGGYCQGGRVATAKGTNPTHWMPLPALTQPEAK